MIKAYGLGEVMTPRKERPITVQARSHDLTGSLTPKDEITMRWPGCSACTWAVRASHEFYLKYISRACPLHGSLPRVNDPDPK